MKLNYNDIYNKCKTIKIKDKSKLFGIPKGGIIPALMIANNNNSILVDTPQECDYIIDDILDSGKTKERYNIYNKPFIFLYEKPIEWIEFPWEVNETPAEDAVIRILQSINEDVKREGLLETPKRHLKYLKEFTSNKDFNLTTFSSEKYDEMITQNNINFYSICEHHLLPFFGNAKISYIPNGKIVGLSKLSRVVDKFANKLQNQERITSQIAEYLDEKLNPIGVAVQLKARHMCMEMRGIKKNEVYTTTTKLIGKYKNDINVKNEFLNS